MNLSNHAIQEAGTSTSSPETISWYAIRVQRKFEWVASRALRDKGYEEFLPLYRSERRWSDRVKRTDQPLFAGYLFCRFNVHARLLPILTTPSVISIVGAGKTPIAIADGEIAAIKTISSSGLASRSIPILETGSRVHIVKGPLAGLEGIVIKDVDSSHLVVSVSLLQRALAVKIDSDWAAPVKVASACAG
jgi:transcription antitermination factor NusG